MRFINKKYRKYYLKAQTVQSIHSPFVYKLLMESIENKRLYNILIELEQLHRARPDEIHLSPLLLSWVFHWIRVVQSDTIYIDQNAPEDLKWLVNRTASNKVILAPQEIDQAFPMTTSDRTVMIILTSNYAEQLTQLQVHQELEIMVVCVGMSQTDTLPSWVNLTVDLFDVQLIFKRLELTTKQAFTVIEKRKKLVDLGLFP